MPAKNEQAILEHPLSQNGLFSLVRFEFRLQLLILTFKVLLCDFVFCSDQVDVDSDKESQIMQIMQANKHK